MPCGSPVVASETLRVHPPPSGAGEPSRALGRERESTDTDVSLRSPWRFCHGFGTTTQFVHRPVRACPDWISSAVVGSPCVWKATSIPNGACIGTDPRESGSGSGEARTAHRRSVGGRASPAERCVQPRAPCRRCRGQRVRFGRPTNRDRSNDPSRWRFHAAHTTRESRDREAERPVRPGDHQVLRLSTALLANYRGQRPLAVFWSSPMSSFSLSMRPRPIERMEMSWPSACLRSAPTVACSREMCWNGS